MIFEIGLHWIFTLLFGGLFTILNPSMNMWVIPTFYYLPQFLSSLFKCVRCRGLYLSFILFCFLSIVYLCNLIYLYCFLHYAISLWCSEAIMRDIFPLICFQCVCHWHVGRLWILLAKFASWTLLKVFIYSKIFPVECSQSLMHRIISYANS